MSLETVQSSLVDNMSLIWVQIASFAPRLFSAVLMLLLGYFISKLVAKLVKVALGRIGIDKLSEKVGLAQLLISWKMSPNLSVFVSKLCFAFIFLIFIISTADVLELEGLSSTVDKLLQYLPNVIGAFFVFFTSSVAGYFAREALLRASESMNLDFGKALGNLAYYSILLVGAILAIGQLKIETDFLTQVIQIVLVTTGIAISLSLGIGSRDVSKNLISGIYLKESLTEGAWVKVGVYEGELVSIKPVNFELKGRDGQSIILPNSRLLDCEILQKS